MMVGILGGGQLGRMIALAGIPLGVRCRFLDPSSDAPAGQVGELVVGEFTDRKVLRAFAKGLDVVTYEFENVPVEAVEFLSTLKRKDGSPLPVHPNANALRTAQDRLLEKQLFERVGVKVPPYAKVDSQRELEDALKTIGLPAVLKTRRMGYDGKGQCVLRTRKDVAGAVKALRPGKGLTNEAGLIVEAFVKFDREVSIIAVQGDRKLDNFAGTYPLVENRHEGGILRTSRVLRQEGSDRIDLQASELAYRIMAELDYIGVLAVELFVKDGKLLGNEIAPRVHNSGHWTIEGAATSQFENHLRAVAGWPIGSMEPLAYVIMHNLIGNVPPIEKMLAAGSAHVHLYGKEPRPGRKVGHVTCVSQFDSSLEADSEEIDRLIRRGGRSRPAK